MLHKLVCVAMILAFLVSCLALPASAQKRKGFNQDRTTGDWVVEHASGDQASPSTVRFRVTPRGKASMEHVVTQEKGPQTVVEVSVQYTGVTFFNDQNGNGQPEPREVTQSHSLTTVPWSMAQTTAQKWGQQVSMVTASDAANGLALTFTNPGSTQGLGRDIGFVSCKSASKLDFSLEWPANSTASSEMVFEFVVQWTVDLAAMAHDGLSRIPDVSTDLVEVNGEATGVHLHVGDSSFMVAFPSVAYLEDGNDHTVTQPVHIDFSETSMDEQTSGSVTLIMGLSSDHYSERITIDPILYTNACLR